MWCQAIKSWIKACLEPADRAGLIALLSQLLDVSHLYQYIKTIRNQFLSGRDLKAVIHSCICCYCFFPVVKPAEASTAIASLSAKTSVNVCLELGYHLEAVNKYAHVT